MLEKDAVNCFLRVLIHSPFDRQQDCHSRFFHKYGYFAQNFEKNQFIKEFHSTVHLASAQSCAIIKNGMHDFNSLD